MHCRKGLVCGRKLRKGPSRLEPVPLSKECIKASKFLIGGVGSSASRRTHNNNRITRRHCLLISHGRRPSETLLISYISQRAFSPSEFGTRPKANFLPLLLVPHVDELNMRLFLLLFAWFPAKWARKLEAEVAKDVSVDICSHLPTYSHANMNFFQQPTQFCVAIRSNKNLKDEMRDLQSTTSLKSEVLVSWRQLATSTSCKLLFKGYQSEYRISPDMGGYEACQNSVSRHLFVLSQAMSVNKHVDGVKFNASNENCPILMVPSTYTEYVACKFTSDEWYVIDWKSTLRYETYRNGAYGTARFGPTPALPSSFSRQVSSIGMVLNINGCNGFCRLDGCDKSDVLIRFADNWPTRLNTVNLKYIVRGGTLQLHVEHLATIEVESWVQYTVNLRPVLGVHEVCAQMVAPLASRHSVCSRIVDAVDCPFAAAAVASSSVPLPFLGLLLFSAFQFLYRFSFLTL
ncbi:unnamed protein product [Caenorhabditis auriculariae]|uniref:Uncharacterized protein n=1 Tax=Caenorhabditis auriculariae TaxID=2777116 RepID=A0A8S1GMP9_9PELO|nr:unnamed protein product [Caenorhabditis auriculariae]